MNVKSQVPIAPHNLLTFNFQYKDQDTGQLLEGQFTTKRLTVNDKAQLGVRASQRCGGMHCVRDSNTGEPTGQGITADTEYTNTMLAHLELALVQKPVWFDFNNISDLRLVQEVYERVVDHELRLKSGGGGVTGSSGMGTQNSSEKSQGTDAGNILKAVVGKEVQASLD
jgi:hypothetical protein